MLTSLRTRWFFFRYEILKPGSRRHYESLLRNEKLSAEEIEQVSWNKTRNLLSYAYEHVPYYRKRFDEIGLHPADITKPEEYFHVPVLTRKDLTENFTFLRSDEVPPSKMRISATGGSSGEPVKVCLPRSSPRATLGWRMLGWWGLRPDCDWARTYRDNRPTISAKVLSWLATWPTKEILLDVSAFTSEDMRRFIKEFNRLKPPLLQGYVGSLDTVAGYILDHGIRVHSPKAIWVTSAPITPVQQHRLESAFGAPVYDQYGCCEIYWLAAECARRKGMHMFHDERRIEFLDELNRPQPVGEYGNIAVTDLMNTGFPLIRYLNGDRGRALTRGCDCGCHLPLMDKVKGRVSETFVLPSGIRVNGEFMTTLFDHRPDAVKQFRVHQHTDYSITIQVIPNPECDDFQKVLNSVVERFERMVNREIPITVQPVERIEQKRGKLQFITSDVK